MQIDLAKIAEVAPIAAIEIGLFWFYSKSMIAVLTGSNYDPTSIKRPTRTVRDFFRDHIRHRNILTISFIIGFCALALISLYFGHNAI